MNRDMDRYGEVIETPNGDFEWVVWGHPVKVAVSEASDNVEVYDYEEDPDASTTVSYVPVYLDGVKSHDEFWAVNQEGVRDLLQNAQMVVESKIKRNER